MRKGTLIMLVVFMLPFAAAAFDQAALNRLRAGDKNLTGADLANLATDSLPPLATFTGVNFTGANLSGAYIPGRSFERCNFTDASFDGANLNGVRFNSCDMKNASFAGANLAGTQFGSTSLVRAKLTGISCTQAGPQFMQCDCQGLDLSGTNFNATARFWNCDLTGVNFRAGNVGGINLESSKIMVTQKNYLAGQNIKQFDTIQWIEPAKYDFKPSAAGKAENLKPLKRPLAPQ